MVSIITASYNKGLYIAETAGSVFAQTYPQWQWIIVDDCSDDDTFIKLQPYLSDPRVMLIRNQVNQGANICRNTGIERASGSHLMFLDADDLLSPQCLEKRMVRVAAEPVIDLWIFTMGVFLKNAGDDKRLWVPRSKKPLEDFLSHRLPWSIMQPLWRTPVIRALGGFDIAFRRLQDVELHTRALLNQDLRYRQVPEAPDCFYRIDDDRKPVSAELFVMRWLEAALMYCNKFSRLVIPRQRALLNGTLFEVLCQAGYQFRMNKIDRSAVRAFKQSVRQDSFWPAMREYQRLVWKLSEFNNFTFKIPGMNRVLKAALTT